MALKYIIKHGNKPCDNIPSHHQYCPAQNYLLLEYNGFGGWDIAKDNSELGNIDDDLVCCHMACFYALSYILMPQPKLLDKTQWFGGIYISMHNILLISMPVLSDKNHQKAEISSA